ncbi:MAG: hypothetical protein CVU84_14850 [Firmicutes bacterium HGW-Firmicutes-1]|jgi:hypothetical protein|nr:MAG: hypothetical protein CVU84_14850 [Firmicutes bacterium HGW-Firmicutes-1]
MEMPSFEVFNETVDQLLGTLKYIKFHELIFKIIAKTLELLGRFIGRIFANKSAAGATSMSAKIILGIILITVIMIVIILILFFIIRKRHKRKIRSILGEKINKDSTVITFLDKSKVYEEKGEYRQAVRLRFVAILFFLHQGHFLYHDSTMTGKEMVAKLKKDKFTGVHEFERITQRFNTIWYGMTEIEEAEFKIWCEEENFLWQGVKK